MHGLKRKCYVPAVLCFFSNCPGPNRTNTDVCLETGATLNDLEPTAEKHFVSESPGVRASCVSELANEIDSLN